MNTRRPTPEVIPMCPRPSQAAAIPPRIAHETALMETLFAMLKNIQAVRGEASGRHILTWIQEVQDGKAACPRFQAWLRNQIAYHGEKDRAYADYLQSLIAPG